VEFFEIPSIFRMDDEFYPAYLGQNGKLAAFTWGKEGCSMSPSYLTRFFKVSKLPKLFQPEMVLVSELSDPVAIRMGLLHRLLSRAGMP